MLTRAKLWLAALAVALAGIIGAWLKGRGQGRADARARQNADYRQTRERIDDATDDLADVPDADIAKRLRDHAKR